MDPIDRTILEFCRDDFHALRSLRADVPTGTLYRHAKRLVKLGSLCKECGLYRTTSAGLRLLAEANSGRRFDALERLYPPLALVPTVVHRATIGLILAAIVARQHQMRSDRHPFFVIFGSTLRWKTSTAIFLCHMLGLDPAMLIVDCGAEAGKSLWVRRSASGTLVFKRDLLDAAFLALDEFLSADTSVRGAIGILLTGRLVTPVENGQVTVHPVPLLMLNPRARNTLEERIGLSAPQIRRAIVVNVDVIAMPDLALIGERAIIAARTVQPLRLAAPRVDCRSFHRAIVDLTRAVILPEAHDRVDVEVVANLCTGMTAFISEPAEAITEVFHAFGLAAETMGWTVPGWIEVVAGFTLDAHPPSRPSEPAHALAVSARVNSETERPEDGEAVPIRTLSLQVPRPAVKPPVPELKLSDSLRARLIWFAVDSGQPLEAALSTLLAFYLGWRRNKATLWTLQTILRLAEQLKIAQVETETLQGYLQAHAALARHNCTFEDVPQALGVIELLAALPEAWDWPRAQAAMQGVASFLMAGISADRIDAILRHHHRLAELGLDETIAEAIAEVLSEAGVTADQRDAVLREMVGFAGGQLDRYDLERKRQTLLAEMATLNAERDRLRRTVKSARTRIHNLEQLEIAGQRRKAILDAEVKTNESELAALSALRALLLRKPGEMDRFCADLERLLQSLRSGGRLHDAHSRTHLNTWLQTFSAFLQQLVAEVQATELAS